MDGGPGLSMKENGVKLVWKQCHRHTPTCVLCPLCPAHLWPPLCPHVFKGSLLPSNRVFLPRYTTLYFIAGFSGNLMGDKWFTEHGNPLGVLQWENTLSWTSSWMRGKASKDAPSKTKFLSRGEHCMNDFDLSPLWCIIWTRDLVEGKREVPSRSVRDIIILYWSLCLFCDRIFTRTNLREKNIGFGLQFENSSLQCRKQGGGW